MEVGRTKKEMVEDFGRKKHSFVSGRGRGGWGESNVRL